VSIPRRPQFSSRPETNTANVTSAVGMQETVGRLRARRNSLFTQTLLWITALACAAFLLGALVQAITNSRLNQQVQQEQQRLQELQAHHDRLQELVNHYQDPAVIESEARQQLNYVRPGEYPVVIIGSYPKGQQDTQKSSQVSTRDGYWQDWWRLFFGG
jgi:cell division protein FtsB